MSGLARRFLVARWAVLIIAASACARRSSTPCTPLPVATSPSRVAGAVIFRNEMSSPFRLTRALFVLDGAVLLSSRGSINEPLPCKRPVMGVLLSRA